MIRALFIWARRHERYVGTIVFTGGFLLDVFTLPLLTLSEMTLLLGGYIAIATLIILITHGLVGAARSGRFGRTSAFIFPLIGQFFISGALSGLVILYTTGSSLMASWPFLIVLAGVFISTEVFSHYRTSLIFQSVLLFFTLYAYAVFLIPVLVGRVGTAVFFGSSVATTVIFATFIFLVLRLGRERTGGQGKWITFLCASILIFVHVGYALHVIPPLPLTLRASGVYHDVSKVGNDFILMGEGHSRFSFVTPIVHYTPGSPLYAFSAIFSPAAFSTHIIHQWEYFDEAKNKWVLRTRVEWQVTGGREAGYRAYSFSRNIIPGKWRVVVETPEGLIIGYISFTAEEVPKTPLLTEERY